MHLYIWRVRKRFYYIYVFVIRLLYIKAQFPFHIYIDIIKYIPAHVDQIDIISSLDDRIYLCHSLKSYYKQAEFW